MLIALHNGRRVRAHIAGSGALGTCTWTGLPVKACVGEILQYWAYVGGAPKLPAGYEPESYTLFSYASVQALAAAFAGAGTTDGPKASEWLKSHSVDTVLGSKSFTAQGDLKDSPYVMYQWDADGHFSQL